MTSPGCYSGREHIYEREPQKDPLEQWLEEVETKETAGVLTYKEAPFGYLKLTSGEHEGRMVIKTYPVARIGGEYVTWFALTLTWVFIKDINDCTCVRSGWGAA